MRGKGRGTGGRYERICRKKEETREGKKEMGKMAAPEIFSWEGAIKYRLPVPSGA